ncbi:MAG: hypothetical protein WBP13_10080 [Methylophilaceae bacterium]
MGMFARTLNTLHFGVIHAEGQSKVWEATIDIPNLGGSFNVRIWGAKDGPSFEQCEAFGSMIAKSETIQAKSSLLIIDYLNLCGVVPSDVILSVTNVWTFLSPSFIEVHANNVYPAGEGVLGSIAISVGYEITWENEHLLQIGLLNGVVDQIYSE